MSAYVTLAAPAPMTEVSKRLARAFDPDVGGYESFSTHATPDPNYLDADSSPAPSPCAAYPDWVVCGFPCHDEFAASIAYLQANPQALLDSTARDYAIRWPDDLLPTLAEVTEFCAGLRISYASGIQAGCAEFGLRIVGE